MSETFVFNAQKREKIGKGASRAARRNNLIPASVYGDHKDPESVLLNPKEVGSQIVRKSLYSNIYNVSINGNKVSALVRHVQLHPVTGVPMHVDFLRIGKNTITRMEIPVTFINQETCPGLKLGGILNIAAYSIEVECKPKEAPHAIEIDLQEAEIGTVIKIEDIKLPKRAKTYYPEGFPIASIALPTEEVETEETETEAEEVNETNE